MKRPWCISKAQRERLWQTAQTTGYTRESYMRLLADYGFFAAWEVTKAKFPQVLEEAGNPERMSIYREKVQFKP